MRDFTFASSGNKLSKKCRTAGVLNGLFNNGNESDMGLAPGVFNHAGA
jgi:hypothetical protein